MHLPFGCSLQAFIPFVQPTSVKMLLHSGQFDKSLILAQEENENAGSEYRNGPFENNLYQ